MPPKGTEKPHPLSKEARAVRARENFKIDPKKSYTFKMTNGSEGLSIIPRTQRVWCETEGKIRDIRYCKTEDSPFVDEQTEGAREERLPLSFFKGELTIEGTDASAIKYLMASDQIAGRKRILPQNESVRGRYYLIDTEADIEAALEDEEATNEAKEIIKAAKEEDLEAFIRSQFHPSSEKIADAKSLRLYAYSQAKGHSAKFIKDFNNPLHQLKAKVQKMFEAGLLDDTSGVVSYKDTKGQILVYSEGRADEALAKWILEGSKEALTFKEVLEEKTK